ncbi:CPBP family intramembrane glutamic endopeptidase [Caulobacter sp. 602-1]|uniref:CPBP family intramembrane glutamic endopeptidase n=1 Tax=Caulobacter sp. 602-1 TaxID=2492472 RepID=UPI000F642188|nr:type II CAAX endopeptidase family protein [Caulobacter sp. 602-1]RRN63887.1 CPBP family intramembrane metalloprotease [Caulobacter sp. 602-1]
MVQRASPALGTASHSVWGAVALYYALALLISWIAWAPLVVSRAGLGWAPFVIPMPWVIVGTLGPLIAAAIVQWKTCRNLNLGLIGASWPRTVLGGIASVVVLAAVFVVGAAAILTNDPPKGWDPSAARLYGFHLLSTFAAGPLFEEWGWRGFAQARLQQHIRPLWAALLVGLGQALWHLPLFLIPTWSSASPPAYFAMVSALAVIIAWGFNLSGMSIIVAIILHATFNASSRVLGGFLGTADVREGADGVVAILVALGGLAIILALATKGQLAYRPAADRRE